MHLLIKYLYAHVAWNSNVVEKFKMEKAKYIFEQG